MLAFDRNANQTLMCWLKEIEICLWPLIETYLLSEFSFFTWFNFICTCVGTEREQPFKELRLSAMNYVNFGKGLRGGMWMGWGSAAGINYGNVGYFAAAPQLNLNVWWEWWWWWWSMVMMMVDYGDGDGDGDGDGGGDGRLWWWMISSDCTENEILISFLVEKMISKSFSIFSCREICFDSV